MTDQNGPRRGDDSVYDPNPDTAYDDDFVVDGAEAAAGTAGAAGGDVTTPGGPTAADEPAGGPPLRGVAMILTAVAVVLIAWGVYSFASGDEDDGATGTDTAAEETDEDAAQDPDDVPGDPDGAPGAGDTDEDAHRDDDEDGDRPDDPDHHGDDHGDDHADADGAGGADAPGGAGDTGPAPVEVDRADAAVTVLNNSGEPLAQTTAERLRDDHQWGNTGYGNLQGRITGISEQTRVYFPEGNARAQAAAEQVAGDLGVTAAPGNPDYYDRFGDADVRNGPQADHVVVVLTGPL